MSNTEEKLEGLKQEIRSILIPYQKGCFLSEFRKAYKDLIGNLIPFKEYGYTSEVNFLYSMPDVVSISQHRSTGDYHLKCIPDEKSMHIAKMVCKQKPARLKPPKSTKYSTFYETYYVPPRFNGPAKYSKRPSTTYYSSSSSFSKPPLLSYENSSRTYQSNSFSNQYESSDNISKPALASKVVADPKPVTNPKPVTDPKTVIDPTPIIDPKPTTDTKLSPAEEFLCLVKFYKNGIPLTEILYEYEQMFDKSFDMEGYGFTSVDQCIEEIEELRIIHKDGENFAIHESSVPKSESSENKHVSRSSSNVNNVDSNENSSKSSSSSHSRIRNKHESEIIIPPSVISKLKQVALKFPMGIWGLEFPKHYKEVTNAELDLYSLGYNTLADFIQDVPDIFVIQKPLGGTMKDFIVSPVTSGIREPLPTKDICLPETGYSLIQTIISNIRKILQAYPEGVMLQDVLHVYSINCKDSLRVNDLGFQDLETFLSSVKDRVPLRIQSLNGMKSIHLFKLSNNRIELPYKAPQMFKEEAIPTNAVFPDFEFKTLVLPKKYFPSSSTISGEQGSSEYIPVFVSNVVNPAHLYIQLQQEKSTEELAKLGMNLDNFYKGSRSMLYAMKDIHIKVRAACAALWPSDQHWYRAQILSCPSMETVRVLYVDYGTEETIHKSLLRYLRKELCALPIQALRCCLSFLRPPNKEMSWSPATKKRLLSMCSDIPLMAKIEKLMPDGVYSIVLCDTNGDQDVFINDVLKYEGLAEYCNDSPVPSIPSVPEPFPIIPSRPPVMPVDYYSVNPLQALQAQYFLQAFAAVVPCFASNEHYQKLLQQISVFCPNVGSAHHNANMSFNPTFATPGMSMLSSGLSSFNNVNSGSTFPSSSFTQEANPLYANPSTLQQNNGFSSVNEANVSPPIRAPTPTDVIAVAKSAGLTPSMENKSGECEFFEDDDDEYEAFCQKFDTTSTRFVKRSNLSDGYKVHVINYNSKPYASSGDISSLIWNNKDADYLFKRLQMKDVDISSLNVSEDGNDKLFSQLESFKVKGVQKTSGFKSAILLYPLKEVIKILNTFGHPSISLRKKLAEEIDSFNPNDPFWMDFSAAEATELKDDENMIGATDDAKIERLCLYDLLAMNEGIQMKRITMLNNLNDPDNSKNVTEISKLETMQEKVSKRIEEIKEICNMFT